jgi:hypothetical protein
MHKIVKITPPHCAIFPFGCFFHQQTHPLCWQNDTYGRNFEHSHCLAPQKIRAKLTPRPTLAHINAPYWPTNTPILALFLPLRRGDSGPKNCKIVSKNEKINPRPTPIFIFIKINHTFTLLKLPPKKQHKT